LGRMTNPPTAISSSQLVIPRFPPAWAEVFGEDRRGIFAEFQVNDVRFVWRWIPPGSFLMGSPPDEAGCWDDEGPQHEVRISQGFWLGEAPVTQAQWRSVMGETLGRFKGDDRPVEKVSWHKSNAFAAKLDELAPDLHPALPTEAQWEYACRAGTQSAFNDGSSCAEPQGKDPALEKLGWFDENSGGQTQEVKQKEPNGWGLYDMHGNVWEWCADGWTEYPATAQTDTRVHGDAVARRVLRGGSWGSLARNCRSACRGRDDPGSVWDYRGLRLAAGQEPEAAEPPGAERPRKR
jgi:formylglycine-generating enzyme required for sulfatase activity